MSSIVAVHAYRGGTGKTNLTANLATVLAMRGLRVGIVDADLQSPGLHLLFGLTAATIDKTLNDYLIGQSAIESVVYDLSHLLEQRGRLFLVPASFRAAAMSADYDAQLLSEGCQRLAQSLDLDYLFIDTHPGLSQSALSPIAIATVLLIVMCPDRQDFQGTTLVLDRLRPLLDCRLLMLLNKVVARRSDSDSLIQQVERAYRMSIAGTFELSEDFAELGSNRLFCLQHPRHPLTQVFHQVARQLTE